MNPSHVVISLQDKRNLIEQVVVALTANLALLKKSAESAHSGATHSDAVAKSKYDTHGLELSYLAGSHFERALRLERELEQLRKMSISVHSSSKAISLGSVIFLATGSEVKTYFLSLFGAGIQVEWLGYKVSVISPDSPIGAQLLGGFLGDDIDFADSKVESEVLAIF